MTPTDYALIQRIALFRMTTDERLDARFDPLVKCMNRVTTAKAIEVRP